jgi:hypothetical protein
MNKKIKSTNLFVTSKGNGYYGDRVWLSDEADTEVHKYLKLVCKWGGSDKREGARVSYEIKRDIPLDTVIATLRSSGMTMRNDQHTMNILCEYN